MSKPASDKSRLDPVVSEHLATLQDRYGRFKHVRAIDHWGGGSFLQRLWQDYFAIGSKQSLELMLRGILAPEEIERLRRDEKFTQAWAIFVDFCWVRRLLVKLLLQSLAFVAAFVFVGGAGWACYQLLITVLTPAK